MQRRDGAGRDRGRCAPHRPRPATARPGDATDALAGTDPAARATSTSPHPATLAGVPERRAPGVITGDLASVFRTWDRARSGGRSEPLLTLGCPFGDVRFAPLLFSIGDYRRSRKLPLARAMVII